MVFCAVLENLSGSAIPARHPQGAGPSSPELVGYLEDRILCRVVNAIPCTRSSLALAGLASVVTSAHPLSLGSRGSGCLGRLPAKRKRVKK